VLRAAPRNGNGNGNGDSESGISGPSAAALP
jgi:hypothetical protein